MKEGLPLHSEDIYNFKFREALVRNSGYGLSCGLSYAQICRF